MNGAPNDCIRAIEITIIIAVERTLLTITVESAVLMLAIAIELTTRTLLVVSLALEHRAVIACEIGVIRCTSTILLRLTGSAIVVIRTLEVVALIAVEGAALTVSTITILSTRNRLYSYRTRSANALVACKFLVGGGVSRDVLPTLFLIEITH